MGWGSSPRHVFPPLSPLPPSSRCGSFRAVHQPSASCLYPPPLEMLVVPGKDQAVTERGCWCQQEWGAAGASWRGAAPSSLRPSRLGLARAFAGGSFPTPSQNTSKKKRNMRARAPKQRPGPICWAYTLLSGNRRRVSFICCSCGGGGQRESLRPRPRALAPRAPSGGAGSGARGGAQTHRAPRLQDPREALPG